MSGPTRYSRGLMVRNFFSVSLALQRRRYDSGLSSGLCFLFQHHRREGQRKAAKPGVAPWRRYAVTGPRIDISDRHAPRG